MSRSCLYHIYLYSRHFTHLYHSTPDKKPVGFRSINILVMQQLEKMLENYPFLSFVRYSHTDYIGVIQNHDGDIVSIYAYNKLRTADDKREFLELADTWWWESNRLIPINIFLKQSWSKFS